MPDEPGGTGPLPSRRGPDPEFQNVVVQLTSAERFIAMGALIVVVLSLLIGDLILSEYSLSNSTWLISLAMLGAIYFFYAGERTGWHMFYPWMIEMGAWALAAIGVADLIRSIFDGIPSSGGTLFFQIVLWVAAGFAGVGAFQLRTQA